jgi:hypothetical protein
MFLVPTFWQTSKTSPYIFFIIFLVPHVFSVSNIGPYCEILVDWTDEKCHIDTTPTYLMTWARKYLFIIYITSCNPHNRVIQHTKYVNYKEKDKKDEDALGIREPSLSQPTSLQLQQCKYTSLLWAKIKSIKIYFVKL